MISGNPTWRENFSARFHLVRQNALRHVEADLQHGVLEPQAVFRHFDGLQRRPDELHIVFIEYASSPPAQWKGSVPFARPRWAAARQAFPAR